MALIDDFWNDLASEAFSGENMWDRVDLGSDSPDLYLEEDDGRGYVEIGYTEYLHFHLEYGLIPDSLLTEPTDEDDPLSRWLNQDGLEYVRRQIAMLLSGDIPRHNYGLISHVVDSLEVNDQRGGDDPHFTVSIAVTPESGWLVKDFDEKYIWPFDAAMINMTDPGTFDHPYLFRDALREADYA